ncbi:hypothetical protein [Paenibacillus sp. L3-i20]|nr:hypothetical protein [Paenibacillus sp. L3-i20]
MDGAVLACEKLSGAKRFQRHSAKSTVSVLSKNKYFFAHVK